MKKILVIFILFFSFSSYAGEAEEVFKSVLKNDSNVYTLGAADKLRITVFNEDELSGTFEIDGSGSISLPLIGEVKAGGRNLRELEKIIQKKFKNGYLLRPRVSIEVLNFRPFFILGEVNAPGSYPYVNRLTILNAVALAGGYTYRAKKSKIIIKRGNREFTASENAIVLPGDILTISERLF